ncbi:hypothetical protein JCM8547_000272 [Rhodosporidiobolus lusitaniae]
MARDDKHGHEQLESTVSSFDPGLKLFVAIAAKVSTLHALAGRYTQHLTLADLSPPGSSSSSPSGENPPTASSSSTPRDAASAQRELDAEQERVKVLMRETIAHSTHWLVLICNHFSVDMAQLPEQPDGGMKLPEALDAVSPEEAQQEKKEMTEEERRKKREKKEWDVVWELVLVSLGLVGAGQQGGEPEREKKGGMSGAAAKVGGLFSSKSTSAPASPDPSSSSDAKNNDKNAPPPLNYTALSRSLVVCTADVLGISEQVVSDVERAIAQFLYFQLQQQKEGEEKAKEAGTGGKEWDEAAQEYREKAAKKGSALKWAATGAGFVLGGVAIGLTGGLAAPALAPVLAGTFGIAAFSGAGGAVLIGTLLGLGGGGLAGYRTHRRMKGVEDMSFVPVKDDDAHELPQIPSLTATILASGFLLDLKDSVDPWRSTIRTSKVDAFALKVDPQTFLEAGKSLDSFVKNRLIAMGGVEVIKRTALAAVYAGVALPLTVFQTATTALDSDFSRCRDKAKKAGILLAEILEKEIQGKRPAILIGYGPGASIIFSCLQELHNRQLGHLVYSAVLISLPEAPSPVAWASARSVVAHELVNAYSKDDYVLAIAARLYTLSARIAGLQPVKVEGITDVDVSDLLTDGHLKLRDKLPAILDRITEHRELPLPHSDAPTPASGAEKGLEEGARRMSIVEQRKTAGEHPEDEEKRRKDGRKSVDWGENKVKAV